MALIYKGGGDSDYLKHKILSIAEAVAIAEKKDGNEPNPFATMLRTLLSKGYITHDVVVTQKKGPPVTITYTRNGPTVLMLTTARDNLDDELRTRLASSKADETRDQTLRIIKRTFSNFANIVTAEEREKWIAFQRWLALDGPYEVVIPYIDAIGDSFDGLAKKAAKEYPLRARRDATALKAAIGASAILHKAQREVDEDRRIIATIDDYRIAHDVIDPSAAEAHHIVIPEAAHAVVEAIEKIAGGGTQAVKVTVRALQEKLGISSTSMAYNRLYEAVDLGLIEVAERPDGKPYTERGPRYYRIVSNSVETEIMIKTGKAISVFPTADEIARTYGLGGEGVKKQQNSGTEGVRTAGGRAVSDLEHEFDQTVTSFGPARAAAPPLPEQNAEKPPLFEREPEQRPSLFGKQPENEPPLFGGELGKSSLTGTGVSALANKSSDTPVNQAKPPKRIIEI
jgi:hypothetical protein